MGCFPSLRLLFFFQCVLLFCVYLGKNWIVVVDICCSYDFGWRSLWKCSWTQIFSAARVVAVAWWEFMKQRSCVYQELVNKELQCTGWNINVHKEKQEFWPVGSSCGEDCSLSFLFSCVKGLCGLGGFFGLFLFVPFLLVCCLSFILMIWLAALMPEDIATSFQGFPWIPVLMHDRGSNLLLVFITNRQVLFKTGPWFSILYPSYRWTSTTLFLEYNQKRAEFWWLFQSFPLPSFRAYQAFIPGSAWLESLTACNLPAWASL